MFNKFSFFYSTGKKNASPICVILKPFVYVRGFFFKTARSVPVFIQRLFSFALRRRGEWR
jgi:hypothetical protein